MDVPTQTDSNPIQREINNEELDIFKILSLPADEYNRLNIGNRVWTRVKARLHINSNVTGGRIPNRQCDICRVFKQTVQELIPHRYKHTNDRKYKCLICYKTFINKKLLKSHIICHSQPNEAVKPIATVSPNSGRKKTIKTTDVQCDICREYFLTSQELLAHRYQHTNDQRLVCLVCFKTFPKKQKTYLRIHFRACHLNLKYKCRLCKKEFKWKASLKVHHNAVHLNWKPHKCDICYKRFVKKDFLTAHLRRHFGQRDHRCDVCHALFGSAGHLNNHKRIHAKVKPFKCDTCAKRFADNGNLNKHKLVHTGEKPFKCDMCDRRFNQSSHLRIHRRGHTGEKPYKCETCDKAFKDSTSLMLHTRIHTGEKPYQCKICAFKTNQQTPLRMHMRRRHAQKHD